MEKELKFNLIYDKNGDDLKKIIVESIVNYLKNTNKGMTEY